MRKGNIGFIFCIIILILIIVGCVVAGFRLDYGNEKTFEITVKDKYIKTYGEQGKYLVVDTNNNTYEIEDLLFKGKFNSTDIYNNLDVGKTYTVTTTGYRMPSLSSYQNINIIEEKQF